MIDKMKEARNKVETEANKTITTYETIKDKEIELQKLEDKITLTVYEAINPDTGKSKYTNDTTRNIAIREIQNIDPTYQTQYSDLRKLKRELEESKLAYDLAKKDFTIEKLDTLMHLNISESNKDESTED